MDAAERTAVVHSTGDTLACRAAARAESLDDLCRPAVVARTASEVGIAAFHRRWIPARNFVATRNAQRSRRIPPQKPSATRSPAPKPMGIFNVATCKQYIRTELANSLDRCCANSRSSPRNEHDSTVKLWPFCCRFHICTSVDPVNQSALFAH